MAVFTPTVRTTKEFNTVYIRVSHNSGIGYIKTGMTIHKSGIRKGKIINTEILSNCALMIKSFYDRINDLNIEKWTVQKLKNFLENKNTDISFTDFAKRFINKMKNDGRDNSAGCYERAVNSLSRYMEKDNIFFNDMTSKVIVGWIDSMRNSLRKKSMYPAHIKTIFNAGLLEYNDYDFNVIQIRVNPFVRIKIPKPRVTDKRSVSADIIKEVLSADITFPLDYEGLSRKEIGRDVAMMIFFLAGINAADLYDLQANALKTDWKLCYNRKKTRDRSGTGSYIEITVPEIIRPLFAKYKAKKGKLFLFSNRYSDANGFVKNVNKGLKVICEELGVEKVTTYTFRHSWATIAQNNCGASTELVAFALNHASVHKITEGYIRKDYSPIDILNKKVIDYVFKETKKADD